MTLDNRVAFRRAFSARREELLKDWLLAHRYQMPSMAHWAKRIEEANDAEMAFASLLEVL